MRSPYRNTIKRGCVVGTLDVSQGVFKDDDSMRVDQTC